MLKVDVSPERIWGLGSMKHIEKRDTACLISLGRDKSQRRPRKWRGSELPSGELTSFPRPVTSDLIDLMRIQGGPPLSKNTFITSLQDPQYHNLRYWCAFKAVFCQLRTRLPHPPSAAYPMGHPRGNPHLTMDPFGFPSLTLASSFGKKFLPRQ